MKASCLTVLELDVSWRNQKRECLDIPVSSFLQTHNCATFKLTPFLLTQRFIRQVHLQPSLDRLNHPKHHSHDKDQYRDPKGIPLHPVPPVMPPLRQGSRLGLIKGLLQNNESVMPDGEIFDPTLTSLQGAAFRNVLFRPECQVCAASFELLLVWADCLEPSAGLSVCGREEQGEGV